MAGIFKKLFNKPTNYVETEKQEQKPLNYVEKDNGSSVPKKTNSDKMKWSDLKPIEISKIKKIDFPEDSYYREDTPKNQVVLHFTVSGEGVKGDIDTWLSMKSRVATPLIVERDGTPYQIFSSKYWAHHLGIKSTFLKEQGFKDSSKRNDLLNKGSIGIEIDNWGGLVLGDGTEKKFGNKLVKTIKGKFYADYGNVVNVPVVEYPNGFRGYYYFEKFTDHQIQTVGELLLFFNKRYDIPLDYNEDMWDISKDALSGKRGIYTHVSYRTDKSDLHPQVEMIEMLKALKNIKI